MSAARGPSDAQMRAWRLAGKLVCTCARPQTVPVRPFDAQECRGCGRRVLADGVGFIAEVLAEVER
jgi:hypothetical protein